MTETTIKITEDQMIQAKLALVFGTGVATLLFGLVQSDPIARTEILSAEGVSAAMLLIGVINKVRNERVGKQKSN